MNRFAGGIVALTVAHDDEIRAAVVSAFMSVSLSPPLVALALPMPLAGELGVEAAESFGISVLTRRHLSQAGAGSWRLAPDSVVEHHDFPFIAGSIAWLMCSPYSLRQLGSGLLVLGEVQATGLDEGEEEPLVRFGEGHGRLQVAQLSEQ